MLAISSGKSSKAVGVIAVMPRRPATSGKDVPVFPEEWNHLVMLEKTR